MKKILILFLLAGVLFLSFGLANMLVDSRQSTPVADSLDRSELFRQAYGILEKKCSHCHGSPETMPFYASWPGAKQLIASDMTEGQEWYRLSSLLEGGEQVSPVLLSKLEDVLLKKKMPLGQYAILHWRNILTHEEEAKVLEWIYAVRARYYATEDALAEDPLQPIPFKVEADARKAALGDLLFHDKRLSGDNTISCASCHGLDKGGTDQSPTSTGIGGAVGPINAPTVFNSGFQFKQFWDGRAADLKEQAAGPVHNPIEMGSNWEQVIPKLEADAELKAKFVEIYPEGFTGDTITDAIAEFEKTLITPNSRFDQYLRGDERALNSQELEGYRLFKEKSCYTCHTGVLLGGQSFEKLGRAREDYFQKRGNVTEADYGRYNVTKKEEDRFKLKVPTLRNLEVTYPYFHDGTQKTIKEAVSAMGAYQIEEGLTADEIASIEAFLRTLTGEYRGKKLS